MGHRGSGRVPWREGRFHGGENSRLITGRRKKKARDRKPWTEQSQCFQKSETVGLNLRIKMRRYTTGEKKTKDTIMEGFIDHGKM